MTPDIINVTLWSALKLLTGILSYMNWYKCYPNTYPPAETGNPIITYTVPGAHL